MMDLSKEDIALCLLDSIPARIVVKDLNGRCVFENHQASANTTTCSNNSNNKQEGLSEHHHHHNDSNGGVVSCGKNDDDSSRDSHTTTSGTSTSSDDSCFAGQQPFNIPIHFPLKDSTGAIIGSCEFTGVNPAPAGLGESTCTTATDVTETEPELTETETEAAEPLDKISRMDEDSAVDHKEKRKRTEDGCYAASIPSVPSVSDDTGGLYHEMMKNIQTAINVSEVVVNEKDEPIDFIFCDINPAFEEFLGVKATDCVGKRLTEVFPGIEGDQADWIKLFGGVAISGVTEKFMHYSEFLKKWYSGFVYQTDAKLRRFAVLFTDVSHQIESQEALRESEERHRNLFESMMQGVVYQDASGSIISANPAAERVLGLTVDQMAGRTSVDPRWESIREDGSPYPGSEHPSMVALKTGKALTGVIMGVLHPQWNEHRWISIDAIPRFRPEAEVPYQVYATFTDVTARKHWEQKVLRAKEKAEEADHLKSAFLANMSHEIRTPLNAVMGYIDLALQNGLSESCRKENLDGLSIAKASGALLLSIIQDILDLSKIEAGQMIVNSDESFSVKGTTGHIVSTAETIIKSKNKNVQFSCNIDTGIKDVILGDPFRLQQVINNMVSNAIKFTHHGEISFDVRLLSPETLEFSVLDTGKGIPPTHIESIFEPFRQVEIGDTRIYGGTGLGLTISRKLVNMMGGHMRVESSVLGPMRGSCFAFTIPYRPSQVKLQVPSPTIGTPMASESKGNSASNNTQQEGKFKILVAEDDPVSRKLVSRMLNRMGYDVALARNGEEAVAAYNSVKGVSLVLMDVQMPVLDGLEATRQIRDREKQFGEKPVPIIALSAGAMKGEKDKGLSYGMTDYLTKPVDLKKLVQALEKYCTVTNTAT